MERIGESTKNMNELIQIYQKLLENSSYGDMKTLQRTLDNAFRQKETEFQGMKQREGDSILPMTVEVGKTVDNLIVQLKEASARDEKMDVDSPGNVLVTRDFSRPGGSSGIYYLHREETGIKLRRKVEELKNKRVDLLTKSTSELTSGKMLKTEFKFWLTNVENIVKETENLENKLAEGRLMEYEASGRILMGKMEEVDEMYRKEKFAESLVAEENAGDANEGGKMAVVGMGGVGKVRLENEEAVNMTFGEISVAEENAGEKSRKKKNSSKAFVGMGGVGETSIESKGAVTMTFGNIKM